MVRNLILKKIDNLFSIYIVYCIMSNSNASLIIAIICITLGFGSVVFGVKNIVFSKNNATDATFVGGSKSSS